MRFWQAIVVSQMTAGSGYADRYTGHLEHFAIETGSLLLGALMWWAGKKLVGTTRPNPRQES